MGGNNEFRMLLHLSASLLDHCDYSVALLHDASCV
jgi:hypothetical protein